MKTETELKRSFWQIYKSEVLQRTKEVKTEKKELELISQCFYWSICSPLFKGDLNKGLYIYSAQGFGKDVILRTIVKFYLEELNKTFKEYTFHEFNREWFEKNEEHFRRPIKINDVTTNAILKRERESIPILEFLDFREQTGLRRNILISSNYTPDTLQQIVEKDKEVKRLKERIIECCNVIIIKDAKSKRVNQTIEI